jgi:hypothetical protein
MNRNTTKNTLKYWHIGMIFYVLISFSGIVIIANVLSAKAAPSSHLTPHNPPDTPTPTDPPVTPTPTPPATPTPAPPPATPTPAPPPVQPTTVQPTRNVVVPPPMPTNEPATPTTTSTVTGTPPTSISVPPVQNTTQQSHPSSESNAGGSNVLALSLGISTSGILLFGGGLFWLYLRRNSQGAVALRKGKMSGLTTNTPWTSSRDRATSMDVPPASDTFTAATPPYANSPLLSSNMDMAANMLQQSISPSPAELAGAVYTPGALQPITMALLKQVPDQQGPALTPYMPASDMNPLSFDTFDLPQDITKSTPPEQRSSAPMPAPANLVLAGEINSSTVTPPSNIPPSAATARLSVQPPDVADDRTLQEIMRQAQTGLFVLSE